MLPYSAAVVNVVIGDGMLGEGWLVSAGDS